MKEEGCSKELNLSDSGRFEGAGIGALTFIGNNKSSDFSNVNITAYYISLSNLSSYESRPKTKFFSLMIYAGYPMQ